MDPRGEWWREEEGEVGKVPPMVAVTTEMEATVLYVLVWPIAFKKGFLSVLRLKSCCYLARELSL